MRAVHGSLHKAETALCRIRMGIAAHVLIIAVIYFFVPRKLFADMKILTAFVRHQR